MYRKIESFSYTYGVKRTRSQKTLLLSMIVFDSRWRAGTRRAKTLLRSKQITA
jgi:hypothetical protein